jgi:glycosidase
LAVIRETGFFAIAALSACLLVSACSDDAAPPGNGFGGNGGTTGGTGGSGGGPGGSGGTGAIPGVICPAPFKFHPDAGTAVSSASIAGEWSGFDLAQATSLIGPDANGDFTGSVDLAPGLWGYKVVLNGTDWELDPGQGYRKYVEGVENSMVRVEDCSRPTLRVASNQVTRPSAGAGSYQASLEYVPPVSGEALDAESLTGTLRHEDSENPVPASALSVGGDGKIAVTLGGLADGKYTLMVGASDAQGHVSLPLRLVFWVEAEPFDWHDAVIYMVMTDRFKDGDPSNDPPPTPGVQDPRSDWEGGDLEGVREKIADGTLDQLGVRALWLTPFQTNPTGPYLASDSTHLVTGYHGYWPIKAREVDPRIGGEAALHALVKEAHAHGIRILMDFVVNHAHEEHEYVKQHPEWFRKGCVCGTTGCDWTEKRLECLFQPYLPDVNWTVTDASEQFISDGIFWLDQFDLDGLRVDAVKHVEDLAIRNLSARIHDEMEASGIQYFTMGETAMGWSDCGLDCNQDQYGTISHYIGPFGLDGQFDFVLYHAVPYRVFAWDQKGFLHADYWAEQSQVQYPQGSIMTPFIGSHDSARFVTLATYRGQPGYDQSIPGNQWDNLAVAPPDAEPYERHALALSWLMGLPGAPLIYYGDEYGEWGGADPGNRAMWRGDSASLSADEQMVLARAKKLGAARRELVALRRGDYQSLYSTELFLAYARRTTDDQVAIVALSRDPGPTTVSFSLPPTFPLADGTTLADRLGGASVTVSGGGLTVFLPGRGAAVYAP